MFSAMRSADLVSNPSAEQSRWPAKFAVALLVVLVSTLLGGTLAVSRHGGDDGIRSRVAMRAVPSTAPQAADRYSFVGTVPDSRSDEREITPVESAGAAPD